MSFVKHRSTSETSKIARKRRKTTGKASEGRLTLVLSSSKKFMFTRQVQIIEEWKQRLGNKLIFFQETPSTASNSPIWDLMEKSGHDSTSWSQWFDAALRCVSECKYVVNHTGNVSFFMNLYRGNTEGVYQFNEFGYMPAHMYPEVES